MSDERDFMWRTGSFYLEKTPPYDGELIEDGEFMFGHIYFEHKIDVLKAASEDFLPSPPMFSGHHSMLYTASLGNFMIRSNFAHAVLVEFEIDTVYFREIREINARAPAILTTYATLGFEKGLPIIKPEMPVEAHYSFDKPIYAGAPDPDYIDRRYPVPSDHAPHVKEITGVLSRNLLPVCLKYFDEIVGLFAERRRHGGSV